MADKTHDLDTFPGAKYWRAMQGSVDAILIPLGIKRRVLSKGTQFVNYDAWTGEAFAHHLCDFLAKNPDRMPGPTELREILRVANRTRARNPHICVARMPERVNLRVARAIIGGGYHEAFHTKYSKRDRVRVSEVQPILNLGEQVTLAGGTFDSKMRGLLMTLHHLVEDIRIERRGIEDFEGARQAMIDLQDFILDLEAAGRAKGAKVKNVTVSMNARSIMLCAFRDLGLGYNSHKARQTLNFYKANAPGALGLLAPGGILAPMLHEAKTLERDDLMGSLRVAMKIVVELWRITQQDEDEDEKMKCPRCGAGAKDLIIRSVRNEEGVKIKGRAELECKVCGLKHEFDLPDNSLNLNQQEQEKENDDEYPEVEDLDQDDIGEGSDGFGDDARERMREQQPEQQGSDGSSESSEDQSGESEPAPVSSDGDAEASPGDGGEEEEGAETSQGDGGEEEEGAETSQGDGGEEEEGAETSQGDGGEEEGESNDLEFQDLDGLVDDKEGSEEEGSEEEGSEEEGSEEEGSEEEGSEEEGSEEEGSENTSAGSSDKNSEDEDWEMTGTEFEEGGGHLDLGRDFDTDHEGAEEILGGDENDGVMTNQTALDQALAEQNDRFDRNLKQGERVWNPYNPMLDEIHLVQANNTTDPAEAHRMLTEVRSAVTYLRARLRKMVRAQEMTQTVHGVRRGRKLSSRMLVNSVIDLKGGSMPKRAFQTTSRKIDTSLDLVTVLDESSSMSSIRRKVAQCNMVLCDSVEGIGGETFSLGFRNGSYAEDAPRNWGRDYHRVNGVRYDIFKTWDEKFVNAKPRFAHTAASGSTPMADGIQFGLQVLNGRAAAHRILAVITDGAPDRPHEQVIQRQIRLAAAAGIRIIGIGIGSGAQYVLGLFGEDNAVWAKSVNTMPEKLLQKLNELCDFDVGRRGRRAKLDNKRKLPHKVS